MAFKELTTGTWEVTMGGLEKAPDVMVAVADGKWTFVPESGDQDHQAEETWNLSGASLTLKETGDTGWFFNRGSQGVGVGIPEEVNIEEISKSFKWRYESADKMDIPLLRNKETKILTLIGTDSDGGPFTISAKKQEE